MSKGGSSSPDSVTQNTSNLPEYAQPYYEDLLTRAAYQSSVPYETYGGSRLQNFTQAEDEAMARFTEMGNSGPSGDQQNAMYNATNISLGNPYAGNMVDATEWSQNAISAMGPYLSWYQGSDIDPGYQAPAGGYQNQYQASGREGMGGDYNPNMFNVERLNNQDLLRTYEDPYQQMVTDINKREAIRDSDIMSQNLSLDAAGAGSLGGYREAIMQAERERNLGQNLSDIQNRGSQDAYRNAQQSLESDRAAMFGAHQGYETGSQAAAGMGLDRWSAMEGARQSQAEMEFGAWNATEQAKQRAAQMGLSAQEIEDAGRQAAENFRLQGRAQDFGGIMNMADLSQNAYNSLLSGDQMRLSATGTMLDADQMRQQMEIERLINMQAAGQTERELMQRGLDIGYGDWLRQQAYPQEQLNYYSGILQGVPVAPGSTQSTYGMGPSDMQQLIGGGIAGVGLYNAYR